MQEMDSKKGRKLAIETEIDEDKWNKAKVLFLILQI